ncbi:MAG TPA: hypothetical protein VLZ32_10655 [Rhodanobacter sp.]|nr:hypothetical protein [Rhodanobacter sp.]
MLKIANFVMSSGGLLPMRWPGSHVDLRIALGREDALAHEASRFLARDSDGRTFRHGRFCAATAGGFCSDGC